MEHPDAIHGYEPNELSALLARVIVGEPLTIEADVLVPLLHTEAQPVAELDATLLGEALERGEARVSEISRQGSVNQVRVRHDGALPLLLLDGDQLLGERQNRVFNASFVVTPGLDVVLPVSCVERGRWAYREPGFEAPHAHGGTADSPFSQRAPRVGSNTPSGAGEGSPAAGSPRSFATSEVTATMVIRANKLRRVTTSVRTGRGYDADQRAVWADVDNYLHKTGVHSVSSALQDALDSRRAGADRALAGIRPERMQLGVALVRHDALAAMDLFGSAKLYARSHDKIMRGILACVGGTRRSHHDASAIVTDAIARLLRAKPVRHSPPGCGPTLHGEANELAFAGAAYAGNLYHAAIAGA